MKMKFTIVILLLSFIGFAAQAQVQADSSKSKHLNVVGFDAGNLVVSLLSIGQGGGGFHNRLPYMATYRRLFGANAIMVGGSYATRNAERLENDTIFSTQRNESWMVGIGYERYVSLAKRWQYYFGGDLLFLTDYGFSRSRYDSGEKRSYRIRNYGYGLAPKVGILFDLNARMALSAEAVFRFTSEKETRTQTSTPVEASDGEVTYVGTQTEFFPPLAVAFRLRL
jgi:hypothetical protein